MKFWKIKSSLVVDSELCLKWWIFDMLWRTVICGLFHSRFRACGLTSSLGIMVELELRMLKPNLIVLWQIRDYGKLVPI
ncbi:unnamed protein product [Prunus brigantina]